MSDRYPTIHSVTPLDGPCVRVDFGPDGQRDIDISEFWGQHAHFMRDDYPVQYGVPIIPSSP